MKIVNKTQVEYLTEDSLANVLELIFPNKTFVRDRKVPNSGINSRPDFRNDDLMLIVEFDGDQHYRVATKIKGENMKTEIYSAMGYKVVRIPYFVQISTATIKYLFDVDWKFIQSYPHGFISDKVVMPADFCELGIKKFISDLERFKFIEDEIIKSLIDKINKNGDITMIVPSSLNSYFQVE